MRPLVAMALVLLLLAPATYAQTPDHHAVMISASPDEADPYISASPSSAFAVYVVGLGLDQLVKGYELRVAVPSDHFLLSADLNPTNALNFGDDDGEFIVGTGGCFDGDPTYPMVTLTVLPLVPATDVLFCVTGTDPSSFPGGSPGYLQCDGTLVELELAETGYRVPAGCLVENCLQYCPHAVEESSMGGVKSSYR